MKRKDLKRLKNYVDSLDGRINILEVTSALVPSPEEWEEQVQDDPQLNPCFSKYLKNKKDEAKLIINIYKDSKKMLYEIFPELDK